MLEVQHKGICYKFHCRIQPAWVADIVRHIPRDWLQTKNNELLIVLYSLSEFIVKQYSLSSNLSLSLLELSSIDSARLREAFFRKKIHLDAPQAFLTQSPAFLSLVTSSARFTFFIIHMTPTNHRLFVGNHWRRNLISDRQKILLMNDQTTIELADCRRHMETRSNTFRCICIKSCAAVYVATSR